MIGNQEVKEEATGFARGMNVEILILDIEMNVIFVAKIDQNQIFSILKESYFMTSS